MIKKGDMVIALAGKDKGKKGKVVRVNNKTGLIVVEGVGVAKRHQKPGRNFPGGIIDKALPQHRAKLMLVCPRCSKPTRISSKEVQGRNVRVCKKCGEIIDKV